MAIIYERNLFSWKEIDNLGDLERFQLVIERMPDKKLMDALANERSGGRKDHPICAMWNSLLACIVFQHPSIEALRRELKRNPLLRELCGFDPLKKANAVPSKSAYSRFISKLIKHQDLIQEIFDDLVEKLRVILPDFGKELAFDSKAILSLSKRPGKKSNDQRGEHDADWGKKKYSGIREDGSKWEKIKSWFGFKLHITADANYELPVAMSLTKASTSDITEMHPMFERLKQTHPEILKACEHAIGDKGYDDTKLISKLWDEYGIKPIIDIRNMCKDGEKTRSFEYKKFQNMSYDNQGNVFCHCLKTGELKKMALGGFERDRSSLKYLCPSTHYGCECECVSKCPLRTGVRIPLDENRRVFTPVARSSYKWKKIYNKRSSVERINSRIHTSFGFERHYIRGYEKMKTRCCLSLCVMLTIAYGRALENKPEMMRSLVRAA